MITAQEAAQAVINHNIALWKQWFFSCDKQGLLDCIDILKVEWNCVTNKVLDAFYAYVGPTNYLDNMQRIISNANKLGGN